MYETPDISILIIEDNPTDRLILYENLMSTHLLFSDVKMVNTLNEGMNQLSKRNFSLIFLDLFLPDSSGLDSLSALLKINSGTPVVIYSGLADTQVALKAISLGAQDFLIKDDYTTRLLEKTVQYSIERKNSSDALRKSNTRFNLISKATHEMLWDWNLVTGEINRHADGWKKIFKTDSKEAGIEEQWPSRVHPDDKERVSRVISELINSDTQQLFEVEFRILRDNDTTGYVEDRGYVSRDEKGKAIHLTGASHDITERKNAEQKVLLSEQRFKSLVQNSRDLIAILDTNGNYTYISPTSKHVLGYEPEFFIGRNTFEFVHEEDVPKMMDSLAALATQKFILAPLFRFRNQAGEWRWIESSITDLTDDPVVGGIVVNSRDVTDKKIADDELKRLSLVAKETNNGVIISDKDHQVVWVNNAFTKLSGYELNEVTGKNSLQFLYGPETDPELIRYVNEQVRKKESFVFEILKHTKNKNKIFLGVQVQPIFDESGGVQQYFALLTDITRQKELEGKIEREKIVRQNEITDAVFAAEESERSAIGRELHDNVNQLLGATRLYIDMARRDDVEDRDSLLASSSAYTMTAIEEIRKLSKTLITPLIKEIGLADSIKELADEVMFVQKVVIILNADSFKEEEFNDKFKLNIFRIVQEVINNTLKHAQANKIILTFKEIEGQLLIVITDDGIGFDTSKRKSGIGITNIKSRVQLHNGTMILASQEGRGTTLSLAFNKTDASVKG